MFTFVPVSEDQQYSQFERLIAARIESNKDPLFTTDADPQYLWLTFLNSLPIERRQYYNCNCCRRFIEKYGNLVTIDEYGNQQPFLWSLYQTPRFFEVAVNRLFSLVVEAKVTGVFLSKEKLFGTEFSLATKNGIHKWTHLCGRNCQPFEHSLKTAEQMMAEKAEDFRLLRETVNNLSSSHLAMAGVVLNQDQIQRPEVAIKLQKWLSDVHDRGRGNRRESINYLWLAVATAPTGFCHVKNTVLGTLIEDLQNGLSVADCANRWNKKLNPLQYQRPTAAPTVGNVEAAEKIFQKLNLEQSLQRRFALLSEIPQEVVIWKPQIEKQPRQSLFAELLSQQQIPQLLKPTVMTWVKFCRDLLPSVSKMKMKVPDRGDFFGLLTATVADSEPIFSYDRKDRRNQFSHYRYHRGSRRNRWMLPNTSSVTAIFEPPVNWYGNGSSKQGTEVFFALNGAVDTNNPTLCLFPEWLRSELREVRSTIEAYSGRHHPTVIAGQQANGIAGFPVTVEVLTTAGTQTVTIDRYE